MSPLRLLFFVLCLLLTASRPLPAAPAPATTAKTSPPAKAEAATGCTAKGCHPAMATGASRHPLKKKCADCHQPRQDRKHPAVKKNAFTLAAAPCLPCHKLVLDQDHLHPPAAAGDCLACHRYHAASPGLLIKDTPQALCRTCHPPVVAKDDTFLHGPIKKGACDLCHRPHGSSYPNLLRANFSKAYENDYNDEQYALCFRCHKIDLLLHPKTSYNTDFRDGKTNLHYVHVNRESAGRSCKLCHETHAGRLPKLMAETVSYGAWSMPLNFEKTAAEDHRQRLGARWKAGREQSPQTGSSRRFPCPRKTGRGRSRGPGPPAQ